MPKNIKVYARIRPFLRNEPTTGCLSVEGPHLTVSEGHSFTFDRIFGNESTDHDIFTEVGQRVSDTFLDGFNTSIIVYGQTGSGKTFTILALARDVVQEVFRNLRETSFDKGLSSESNGPSTYTSTERASSEGKHDAEDFSLQVSAVEVYNEQLQDLLGTKSCAPVRAAATPNTGTRRRNMYSSNLNAFYGALTPPGTAKSPLLIREDSKEGVNIVGLTKIQVHEEEELLECMSTAFSSRKTASTLINSLSSRSHCIFTLTLQRKGVISKCCFVDLAGSERLKRAHNFKKMKGTPNSSSTPQFELGDNQNVLEDRIREGISINSGLLALGNVIVALSGRKSHVPYRSSKLTRLLEPMLGGNSETYFFACVSPLSMTMDETLNTLRYAERARAIRTKPHLVISTSQSLEHAEKIIISLREELRDLRIELRALHRNQDNNSLSINNSPSINNSDTDINSPVLKAAQLEVENLKVLPEPTTIPSQSTLSPQEVEFSKQIADLQAKLDHERQVTKCLEEDLFYSEYTNMMQEKACEELKGRVLELEKLLNSQNVSGNKLPCKIFQKQATSSNMKAIRSDWVVKNLMQLRQLENEWCAKQPVRV